MPRGGRASGKTLSQGVGSLAQAAQPPSQAARPRAGGEARGEASRRAGPGGGMGSPLEGADGRPEPWQGAVGGARLGGPERGVVPKPLTLSRPHRARPKLHITPLCQGRQARSRGGRGPGRIRAPLSDSGDCKPRDRRRAGGGGRRARGLPERLARARRDGRRGGAWGELSKPLPFSRLQAPLRAGGRRARALRSQTLGPARAGATSRPEHSGGRAKTARGLRAQRRRTAQPAAARARRPGPHG